MLVLFVGMAVSSVIVGVQTSDSSANTAAPLVVYCILNTAVLTMFVVNSKLRGLKLAGVTFIIFWGIQYFMTQIETLYFNSAVKMQLADIMKVVVSGALSAVIFSLSAVLIFGRFKKRSGFGDDYNPVKISFVQLIPNIAVLAVCYVLIYFLFGYFVAWQFADLRYYYSGSTQILNLFQHMSNQFQTDPVLPLFQLFRGLLWSMLSMLIIWSLNTRGWKTYFISGFLFSILISSTLVFPNAYMPAAVRFGHSIELVTSMFTFGVLSVLIFKNKLYLNSFCSKKFQRGVG